MTTVLMIPNSDKKEAIQGARQFSAHLAKLGGRVVSSLDYQSLLQGVCDGFYPTMEALDSADMVICIGGDGTIIRSAKLAISMDKPILGINSGRLGFWLRRKPTRRKSSPGCCRGIIPLKTV